MEKNKERIEMEKRRAEEFRALRAQQDLAEQGVVRTMDAAERNELLRHLKIKWATVNTAYQKLTFTLDTPAKQKRKEGYEAQLSEIERDIRMLEKGESIVVVDK